MSHKSHGPIAHRRMGPAICLTLGLFCGLSELAAGGENPGAEGQGIEAVTDRYLAAIQAQDWDTMRSLLAPDAHYLDFTMEHFGLPVKDLRGPEAIVDFWSQSSRDSGTVSIRFDFGHRFAAGPNLILRGHSEVAVLGSAWDLPVPKISTRFPQITHLRVAEGRITHHTDHVDYPAAEKQIVAQVESHNREHGTSAKFPVSAVDDDLREVALDYLETLHQGDFDGLRRWLGSESRYSNFTAEAMSGFFEEARGAEAMIDLFRTARARSGTLELKFDLEQSFVAGPNVYLVGLYGVTARGEAWRSEAETVEFRVPLVVHLRILEGEIRHHVEYMDYAAGLAQLPGMERASGT